MNDAQLRRILHCTNVGSKFTVGVYAADKLPYPVKKPAALIANTDIEGQPGEHWVAFFVPVRGQPEYFDSYGMPSYTPDHMEFMSKYKTWKSNTKTLQSLTSKVCGQYCLTFLITRMRGFSMKQYQSLFTEKSNQKDQLVRSWIKNTFKYCNIKCNRRGQTCGPRLWIKSTCIPLLLPAFHWHDAINLFSTCIPMAWRHQPFFYLHSNGMTQ